jgi:phosphoribosylamine--glycine ligase
MLVDKKFGDAGNNIIIEERIDGIEASYIALSDGKIAIPMATSQDHKRVFDNDKGPNTGGMGAYSPTSIIDNDISQKIQEKIIDKTISALKNEGITFKGFLYAGIMLKDGEPYVLEYNVRMGDPECQPILMRMDSDLFEYLMGSVNGTLKTMSPISWKNKSAVCIVLASNGYPESYPKGDEIFGLEKVFDDGFIFQAGTKRQDKKIITNGGRVLGVTALGDTLELAINHAYNITEKISWKNKYLRTDIGKKGLTYL